MREDMFQVIIERPRRGGGRSHKGRAAARHARFPESAPPRESISRGRGTKHLNENLAPLRRFLERRVGRPWDGVHGEIAAHLAPGNAVQQHVLDHVRDFVEEHPVMIDGWPHRPAASRGRYQPLSGSRWSAFYVCPATGQLRALPRRRHRRPRPPVDHDRRVLGPLAEAHRVDGLWYHIEFAPLPATAAGRRGVRDVLLRRDLGSSDALDALRARHGRADRYAARKRQLSAREVARLPG